MGTVEKVSKNKDMVRIINASNTAFWYFFDNALMQSGIGDTLTPGDEVTYSFSKTVPGFEGKQCIHALTVTKKGTGVAPTPNNPSPAPGTKKEWSPQGGGAPKKPWTPQGVEVDGVKCMLPKTPEEAERITRLSVASSASESLKTLAGMLDPASLYAEWEKMYTGILNKIKE